MFSLNLGIGLFVFKFLNLYDQLAILVFDYLIRQQTVHFAFIYYYCRHYNT